MSYLDIEQMSYKDGPALDAFGRLRTSVGAQLFGTSQEYTPHPLVWDIYTVTGGTAVHNPTTNSSTLSTNASTSGARAMRQTKTYHRYTPGKSQFVKLTGVIRSGLAPSGTAFASLGYYDDNNGIFFRDSAAGVYVGERSNVSGSVVETLVLQAAWNIDKFDGTGPSGKVVDWTKTQIFVLDLQWLGAGRIRYGLDIDGVLHYAHQSVHANLFPSVYMATANLPIRYEVFNKGGTGSAISLNAICSSVESEGGVDESSIYTFCFNAYITTPLTIDTTLRPIVTRRLKATFGGKDNHGQSHLRAFIMRNTTNDIYWEVRYNPVVTLGAGGAITTTDADANYSLSEYDTYAGAANTVAGGVAMFNGFSLAGNGQTAGSALAPGTRSLLQIGKTYTGVRDTYTLCARAVTGSASLSIATQIEEHY